MPKGIHKRILRRPHRRRWRSCTLCVHRKVCQVRRFIENVAEHIGILECKHFISERLLWRYKRINPPKVDPSLFLFTTLADRLKQRPAKTIVIEKPPELVYRDNRTKGRFLK